LAKENTKQLKT